MKEMDVFLFFKSYNKSCLNIHDIRSVRVGIVNVKTTIKKTVIKGHGSNNPYGILMAVEVEDVIHISCIHINFPTSWKFSNCSVSEHNP